jgi:L-ribulose-5-phosphate 4-epimerase
VEGNYELETGYLITKLFADKNPIEQPMVLVAGHGPFTWGKSAQESIYNAIVLEEICKMALFTLTINHNAQELPSYLREKHYSRKHGPNAYYGQEED